MICFVSFCFCFGLGGFDVVGFQCEVGFGCGKIRGGW